MSLILVATDFSVNCSKVLQKAIFLANEKKFKLKVVHVVEDGIFNFYDHKAKIKFNCMKFLNEKFSNIEGRSALMDGFGLIAFASIFPMITVMDYSIFFYKKI